MTLVIYPNLQAELARYGIEIAELSEVLGTSKQNVYNKLKKRSAWSLSDMTKIQAYINDNSNGVSYTLDYLFKEQIN